MHGHHSTYTSDAGHVSHSGLDTRDLPPIDDKTSGYTRATFTLGLLQSPRQDLLFQSRLLKLPSPLLIGFPWFNVGYVYY
jgi:hypothetical protein